MVGIVAVLVMMFAARFWNSVPKMWFMGRDEDAQKQWIWGGGDLEI